MIRRLLYSRGHVVRLINYGEQWHKESVMRDLPFSRKRCEAVVKQAMTSPDQIVLASLDDRDNPQGVLIGALCAYPFFEAHYATDLVFIAHKEGAQLFHAFERWAREHKAGSLQMGVTSGIVGADDFYRAAGLIQIGGVYYMRL